MADVRVVRGNELHCSVRPADVPALADLLRARFGAELLFMAAADRRADRGTFEVHYLFAAAREDWFLHATAAVPAETPTIASLATFHYPASRFEREIYDLFGIIAEGHPDARPLVRHGFWPADYFPLRKDAAPREFTDDGRAFPFTEVGGEGVYEIPVGPVHAGVIEPGHFRFSVVGETIIDMKSRLYFTHKGTEKLFEGREPGAGVELAERISGDTTVGHALAFCQALEAAAGMTVPERARYLRVVLLEMERLYNHVGDCRHDRQRHGVRGGALPLLPDPRAAPAAEQAAHGEPAAARRHRPRRRRARTCRRDSTCPRRSRPRSATSTRSSGSPSRTRSSWTGSRGPAV